MNKCPVCEKTAQTPSIAFHNIHVCLICFFDGSVPKADSYTGSHIERHAKRMEAIEVRKNIILAKVANNNVDSNSNL
jgi:hypothetical protein